MSNFEVNAVLRDDKGKGASRRLRRANKIPAVLYGGGKEAVALSLDHDVMMHKLENESFYNHILTVSVDGKAEKAVLKDLQRHAYKPAILHLDLQRINESEKLRMNIPLHFIGGDVAPGVKQAGGLVSHLVNDVEINCLPKDLPAFIEVDITDLGLDETLHLSDIKLPQGVELVELTHGAEHDQPVVSIHMPRAAVEVTPEEEETAAAEVAAAAPEEEKKDEGEA